MKTKKLTKKLTLRKRTISNLNKIEMRHVIGAVKEKPDTDNDCTIVAQSKHTICPLP